MDSRAQNAAIWSYAARSRNAEVDGQSDLERGTRWLLGRARRAEQEDRLPDYFFPWDAFTVGAATCARIDRFLATRSRIEREP